MKCCNSLWVDTTVVLTQIVNLRHGRGKCERERGECCSTERRTIDSVGLVIIKREHQVVLDASQRRHLLVRAFNIVVRH